MMKGSKQIPESADARKGYYRRRLFFNIFGAGLLLIPITIFSYYVLIGQGWMFAGLLALHLTILAGVLHRGVRNRRAYLQAKGKAGP